MTARSAWRPTTAFLSAAATVLVLLLLGVALHRPDLVVLATPLAAAPALAVVHRRSGAVRAVLAPSASRLAEGVPGELYLTVDAPPGTELLTATVAAGDRLAVDGPVSQCVLAGEGTRELDFPVRPVRWGRTRSGLAVVSAVGAQGMVRCAALARDAPVTVGFGHEPFRAGDLLPQASGVVGAHRSRRPGEGSDLAGVRPFVAGDRLRRIHWPVSLRTGDLHVTATDTDRDATVMIVLDSSVDAGADAADGSGSLGTGVRAAAAIAEHYLRVGDRVGLIDTRWAPGLVRPGAGRRHLERIVDVLLDADTRPTRTPDPVPVERVLSRAAPRSLVILISPLIDRPELAAGIRRSGHTVAVVDTLPPEAPAAPRDSSLDLAVRLQRLRHRSDVERLADLGIPTVVWGGSGSLDGVLRSLARAASAPRAVR